MIPYWILFAVWAAGTIQHDRSHDVARSNVFLWLAGFATALMIGLRYQVGGDWGNYDRIFNGLAILNFRQAMASGDPAYGALCSLAAKAGLTIVAVNMVCGAIFMAGLTRFAARQPNPWLTILVGVPYFIIVVAMGYTRQATAIGIILAGLAIASERNIIRTIVYIVIAASFHKSAVLALPVVGVAVFRRNPLTAAFGALIFMSAYLVFLSSSVDTLVTNYVDAEYDSQGATIRVAMDVLAAVLFFSFRRSMNFTDFERAIWTTFAVLSLASLAALFVVSSTTGVDRIALFLIPLQIVVLGRLPYISRGRPGANGQLMLAVIAYSFAVQFVWLNFADNAGYWVPYNASPFATVDT